MKASRRTKVLTFGDYIAEAFAGRSKRTARSRVRLAVNTHEIRFLSHARILIT